MRTNFGNYPLVKVHGAHAYQPRAHVLNHTRTLCGIRIADHEFCTHIIGRPEPEVICLSCEAAYQRMTGGARILYEALAGTESVRIEAGIVTDRKDPLFYLVVNDRRVAGGSLRVVEQFAAEMEERGWVRLPEDWER